MIEQDKRGINVIVFGGDIAVSAGHLDDPDKNWTFVSFGLCAKGEIGRLIRYHSGYGCQPDRLDFDHHTRLVFTDPKSIDVVISKLKKAKDYMIEDERSDLKLCDFCGSGDNLSYCDECKSYFCASCLCLCFDSEEEGI